jgi:hypothetical protein
LAPDTRLNVGDTVTSSDGSLTLVYQSDGNLVLYQNGGGAPPWASCTAGHSPGFVAMQGDGNFVVYDADGHSPFSTRTDRHPGATLTVGREGRAEVVGSGGETLWRSDTYCR